MPQIDDAEHFRLFYKVVERAITKYGHLPEEDMTELQRRQVEGLAKLENDFRKALIKDPNGTSAYEAFVAYILDDKKNILAARPYFRERRSFFASDVSSAIRNRDIKKLQKFHCNYHFINLVTKGLVFGIEVNSIVDKIKKARQELIILNLPLVINRARIFWSRTNKSHLSFMDLIQIGVGGLIAGIDKYCGQYSKIWRDVAIGRMVGDMIEKFSSTMLHFYPKDKRMLYRANKFKSRHIHGDYDIEDLVKDVGKTLGGSVDQEELVALMSASAIVSADASSRHDMLNVDNVQDTIARYAAPEEHRPDLQVEHVESNFLMQEAIKKLSLVDKKLLILKGLDISLE